MRRITLVIHLMLLVCFSFASYAAKNEIKSKKVKAKCFVEVLGGQNTIVYQMIRENKLSGLGEKLTNKSLHTTLSDKKVKIYKVNECVLDSEEFSTVTAKSVEKLTAK